jgi:ribonuclease D
MFPRPGSTIIAYGASEAGTPVSEEREIGLIATQDKAAELAAALSRTNIAAIDTEFVREKTYYPQLCLVQIATKDQVACIDCLAPIDASPIYDELFRPGFTWVLHSARQDLEVIWQRTERLPPRLFDTQIAGALTGMAAQAGLETLLATLLGVELGESYARTDWSRRPLPVEALAYALDDVRYLLTACERLEARLAELGRSAWLEEECARALDEPPDADPVAVWQRLKGVNALTLPGRCTALELVRWREAAAQRSDRPRRWLLADETLLAIAAARPGDIDALAKLVPPKFAARFGADVLAAVARDNAATLELVQRQAAQPQIDKQIVKALQEKVRERAAALGIEPEILATRRDLVALAAGDPPEHLRTGWRAEILAPLLDAG